MLIPFGGGSNIVAALEAEPGETRQVVSLNLGRLNKVLEIDEVSGLAHIEAGVFGPDMEDQLNARGWTMGHHPDSFVWSTLGGWIATRSSGMQSDKYGDIADICRGLTMVMPGQVLTLRPLPSSSSGPSVREMVLGSEGRLGVITSAWVNVHRIPEVRELQAYFFATYEDGLKACQEIVESDASVMMARVSDAIETQYIMANGKKSSRLGSLSSKAIQKLMLRKGWDLEKIAMSFVGFEGSPTHVRYEKGLVAKIVRKHGGLGVGKGPGSLYDQKKYDTPYIRDFMLDRGLVADVSETTTPWKYAEQIHTNTVAPSTGPWMSSASGAWCSATSATRTTRAPASTSPSRSPTTPTARWPPTTPPSGCCSSPSWTTTARCRTTTAWARSTARGWIRTSRPRACSSSAPCSTAWTRATT